MNNKKNNDRTKFGIKKLLLILAAIFIPVIGPILVIFSKRFKKTGKIIAGIWLALMVVIILIPRENNEEQNINVAQEETQEITEQTEPENINDTQMNEETKKIEDKQLEININDSYEINSEGKLIYKAKTNLSENMNIMFTLESKDYDYYAQNQSKVKNGGYIESDPFSSYGSPLKSGEYIMNISSSKPSIQPENVRKIIGENGEKITGDFISDGMLDFEKKFNVNNKYDVDYFIADKEDISMADATRYNWNIVINDPVTPEQMKFVSKEIIESAKQDYKFNALTLMFYDYEEYIGDGYTLGKTTYAPDGEWAKASTVNPGNYNSMEYVFELKNKNWDIKLTQKEVEIWSEIQKKYAIAYENADANEIVDEDEIHQKVADKFNMSKERVSDIHIKKGTWHFNDRSDN